MHTPSKPLLTSTQMVFHEVLARISSETGIAFALDGAGNAMFDEDDVFKVAAVVDLALSADLQTMADLKQGVLAAPKVERKPPTQSPLATLTAEVEAGCWEFTDKRTAAEQEKLAEAGRKSWVTRRANEAQLKSAAKTALTALGKRHAKGK